LGIPLARESEFEEVITVEVLIEEMYGQVVFTCSCDVPIRKIDIGSNRATET